MLPWGQSRAEQQEPPRLQPPFEGRRAPSGILGQIFLAQDSPPMRWALFARSVWSPRGAVGGLSFSVPFRGRVTNELRPNAG